MATGKVYQCVTLVPRKGSEETGPDVKFNIQLLYSKQIKLIGSTGGARKEMTQLIDMCKELKARVWKKFTLDEAKEALQALFAKERDGRILLEVS
jgi:D-arabinose 1-dehydrogenase-like Zn-dependent alcohol dehydrogenase